VLLVAADTIVMDVTDPDPASSSICNLGTFWIAWEQDLGFWGRESYYLFSNHAQTLLFSFVDSFLFCCYFWFWPE